MTGVAEWVLVPRTMSFEMEVAFCESWFSKKRCIDDAEMQDAYAAMLAAAPSAQAEAETFEQWFARVDARFWNSWDACNAAFHAGQRSALSAQPRPDDVTHPQYEAGFKAGVTFADTHFGGPQPASAPVEMDLRKRALTLLQAEYDKPYFAGNYEDAAIDAIEAAPARQPAADFYRTLFERAMETAREAMDYVQTHVDQFDAKPGDDKLAIVCREFLNAQQPAAVDEAMVQRGCEALAKRWRGDGPVGIAATEDVRAVLSAALAQPQGEG